MRLIICFAMFSLVVSTPCIAVEFEDPLETVVHFSQAASGIYLGRPI